MNIQEQISAYINSLPQSKSSEMQELHNRILKIMPASRLWYMDGKNSDGKVVSNPNIGYGSCNLKYADGTSREFYQIGISANSSGISVYIMGISDKTFLSKTYGLKIGKASISGYCIKFRKLSDIDMGVLEEAIREGIKISS